MTTRTLNAGLCIREGNIQSRGEDGDESFEIALSTGAAVRRYTWDSSFIEILDMKPSSVRMDRLNNKMPVLNNHRGRDLSDLLGAVVEGTGKLKDGTLFANVRLSERKEVRGIVNDIRSGILSKVSIGYRVYKYEESVREDGTIVRTAVDWEPYEVSFVCIPADDAAGVRSEDTDLLHECEINVIDENRENDGDDPMTGSNDNGSATATGSEGNANPTLSEAEIRQAAFNDIQQVNTSAQALFPDDAVRSEVLPTFTQMISNGSSVDEVRTAMIDEVAKRANATPTSNAQVTRDERDTFREGMADAVTRSFTPTYEGLSSEQMSRSEDFYRDLRGSNSLHRLAANVIQYNGGNPVNMSPDEMYRTVTGQGDYLTTRAGGHTNDDFSFITGINVNRRLRDAYDRSEQTFRSFVRSGTAKDFRQITKGQMGDFPAMEILHENAEIKYGTFGEFQEPIQLATFAKGINISRKLFINDDVDGLMRIIDSAAYSGSDLESDLVYSLLNSPQIMSDGEALFSAAHNNIATVDAPISIASLSEARKLLRQQRTVDGAHISGITPKYLIVPPSLETIARQFTSANFTPDVAGNDNEVGRGLTPIVEVRLTDTGVNSPWFVSTSPGIVDTLEIIRLEGQTGIEMMEDRDKSTLGLSWKAYMDVGVSPIDFRGMVRNNG